MDRDMSRVSARRFWSKNSTDNSRYLEQKKRNKHMINNVESQHEPPKSRMRADKRSIAKHEQSDNHKHEAACVDTTEIQKETSERTAWCL